MTLQSPGCGAPDRSYLISEGQRAETLGLYLLRTHSELTHANMHSSQLNISFQIRKQHNLIRAQFASICQQWLETSPPASSAAPSGRCSSSTGGKKEGGGGVVASFYGSFYGPQRPFGKHLPTAHQWAGGSLTSADLPPSLLTSAGAKTNTQTRCWYSYSNSNWQQGEM